MAETVGRGTELPSVPMRKTVLGSTPLLPRHSSGAADAGAGDGLQEARRQQRYQQQVDAVEAAEDAAVAGADDGLVLADEFAHQSAAGTLGFQATETRGLNAAVEGIVRILAAAGNVVDGGEAERGLIDLSGESGLLRWARKSSSADGLPSVLTSETCLPLSS